jgi:hypothetical protein
MLFLLGPGGFLPNPFKFTIHWSSYHSARPIQTPTASLLPQRRNTCLLKAWTEKRRPVYCSTVLLLDLGRFFRILILYTVVGLLGRGISPSQGLYIHTEQHKHRINAHRDIHNFSGIRTHDPNFRARGYRLCLRPRGHCDRQNIVLLQVNKRLRRTTSDTHIAHK